MKIAVPRRLVPLLVALFALAGSALVAKAGTSGMRGLRAQAPRGNLVASRFSPAPGPLPVDALDLEWLDADRRRTVPVRLYYPRQAAAQFPVVVFSSGLGAGRDSLEFLGRHLASRGYISVHVQHPGGDAIDRLHDLVFLLDRITALAASSPVLRGRIDLQSIAVGGVELGASTALAVAGGLATPGPQGGEPSQPDPRVKAAVLLMPPAASGPGQRGSLRFEPVTVPCLHVIGSLGPPPAAERRFDFDPITAADQILVVLQGDLGQSLSMHGAAADTAATAMQDHLKVVATAFLDGYLRHIAAARQWVDGGGLAAALGAAGRVEARHAAGGGKAE